MSGLSTCFNVPSLRAVAVASAQGTGSPTVTLYGIADVGYTQVTGLKAGTVSQIASGIMEGSRWGLKGSEDMGGGYKTIFTLESRFELDTGALGNRPISGTQISDRYSTATLMGLPASLQPSSLCRLDNPRRCSFGWTSVHASVRNHCHLRHYGNTVRLGGRSNCGVPCGA